MTITSAYQSYLKFCATSACAWTLESKSINCQPFFRLVAHKPLEAVTQQDLADWVMQLHAAGLKGSTIAQYVTFVCHFFNWCADQNLLPASPFNPKKLPKIVEVPPDKHPLSFDQHRRILIEARTGKHKFYWRHACQIGYSTGLRISDVAGLEWSSVDFDTEVITVLARKTKRFRKILAIPMETELVESLRDLKANPYQQYSSPYVLPDMQYTYEHARNELVALCRRLFDRAGIDKKYSYHSYRHGFVTRLLEADVNILTICSMTGQSPDQVRAYAHISVHAKREALDKARTVMHAARLRERGIHFTTAPPEEAIA